MVVKKTEMITFNFRISYLLVSVILSFEDKNLCRALFFLDYLS